MQDMLQGMKHFKFSSGTGFFKMLKLTFENKLVEKLSIQAACCSSRVRRTMHQPFQMRSFYCAKVLRQHHYRPILKIISFLTKIINEEVKFCYVASCQYTLAKKWYTLGNLDQNITFVEFFLLCTPIISLLDVASQTFLDNLLNETR